jgi:hypothetical protein
MNDAIAMLLKLSGRAHQVLTAVALRTVGGLEARVSRSSVTFRSIGAGEARAYWNTGEPRDKAGAYAIQGSAAVFIADLKGSYSGVMGLPLFETAELLKAAGVACWQRHEHWYSHQCQHARGPRRRRGKWRSAGSISGTRQPPWIDQQYLQGPRIARIAGDASGIHRHRHGAHGFPACIRYF